MFRVLVLWRLELQIPKRSRGAEAPLLFTAMTQNSSAIAYA